MTKLEADCVNLLVRYTFQISAPDWQGNLVVPSDAVAVEAARLLLLKAHKTLGAGLTERDLPVVPFEP